MLKFTIGTLEKIQRELITIEHKVFYYDKDKDTTVEINRGGIIKRDIDIKIDLKNELEKIFNNDKEELIKFYKNNLYLLDNFVENLVYSSNKRIKSIIANSTVYIAEDGIPYLNIHCIFSVYIIYYIDIIMTKMMMK